MEAQRRAEATQCDTVYATLPVSRQATTQAAGRAGLSSLQHLIAEGLSQRLMCYGKLIIP
jgi:hypothetical protein